MTTTLVAPAAPEQRAPARQGAPTADWSWLGLAPFAAYVLLFLALPTVIAVASGLFDGDGAFTVDNIAALADPVVVATFWNSTWVSALTAVIGAVVGALVCYAMLGLPDTGFVRTTVDAASGVLAQFGGVMLAFTMVAAIGTQGVVTRFLRDVLGVDIFAGGAWIYALPGLIPAYLVFQVPLMIITFMPALAALRPQWFEAHLTLGGTRRGFWLHVGFPVLAPSFLASLLLLFANAFSSYATAAALASQGSQIVPLQIRTALTSETVLGRENLAGALALGMIAVVAVVMWVYSLIQRRAARWQA
ncbi:putative spermidine/putrescine transport system permease protein [Microbacterium terrae]|uniref:Binding-protein-dependent transport system inner membrane component n=1 Tax=Microbacterium terrae TaxID=69369 RepID=A0A0M2H095_9MICO|nr:ABC transporter permease subunit [Microbacterium terrae]KJL37440.1 Binding-protein-dependent transport system inner membrane component [Microbacterium terrae]MBP1076268.1 putative spermidine/putrescine transport system permease protein [Microbacterium terrae]GLJ97090.1 ABC transporter permease [Microbacterium terrae]